MRALLSWKRGEHHKKSAELLETALKEQMESLRGRPFGLQFLIDLNPSRMLDMAKLFIQHVGGEPRSATEPLNEYLHKCQRWAHSHAPQILATFPYRPWIVRFLRLLPLDCPVKKTNKQHDCCRTLELITKHCPGLLEAQVQLARCAYLGGSMEGAQRKAADCLRLNQGCSDAHLLIAHIFLIQGKPSVRSLPAFHSQSLGPHGLNGRVGRDEGLEVDEAVMEGRERHIRAPTACVSRAPFA